VRPTVYIETTIPSYYHDDRKDLANDIQRTRQWWDLERQSYECFVSAVVVDELAAGSYPNQSRCLDLVSSIPLLAMTPEVIQIAEAYQATGFMPKAPVRDALHVAIASHYRMDFLLTWNCRHLANVHKSRHLEVLNVRMGLAVPRLVTPHLLQPLEEIP
jgi:predicted nucleic acid-binding protein